MKVGQVLTLIFVLVVFALAAPVFWLARWWHRKLRPISEVDHG